MLKKIIESIVSIFIVFVLLPTAVHAEGLSVSKAGLNTYGIAKPGDNRSYPNVKHEVTSIAYNSDGSAVSSNKITLENQTATPLSDYMLYYNVTNGVVDSNSIVCADTDVILDNDFFVVSNVPAAGSSISFTYNENIPAANTPTKTITKYPDFSSKLSVTRVVGNNDSTEDTSTLHLGDDIWYYVKVTNIRASDIHQATTSATQNLILVGDESTIQDVPSNDSASYYVHFTVDEDTLGDTSTCGYVRYSVSFGDQSASLITPVEKVINDLMWDNSKYNEDGSEVASYVQFIDNNSKYRISNYKFKDIIQNNGTTLNNSSISNVTGAAYDSTTGTFTVDAIDPGDYATIEYTVTIPSSDSPKTGAEYQTMAQVVPENSKWNISVKRVTENDSQTLDTSPLILGKEVWYCLTVDNTDSSTPISAADVKTNFLFMNLTYTATGTITQGNLEKTDSKYSSYFIPGEIQAGESASVWIKYTVSTDTSALYPNSIIMEAYTAEHSAENKESIPNFYGYNIRTANMITGDEPAEKAKFNFLLTAGSQTTPMPNSKTGGIYRFDCNGESYMWADRINYTDIGTYTYTLQEEDSGVDGYTYDSNVYTIHVSITKNSSNILTMTKTITDNKGNPVEKITFTNSYKANDNSNYTVPNTADKS